MYMFLLHSSNKWDIFYRYLIQGLSAFIMTVWFIYHVALVTSQFLWEASFSLALNGEEGVQSVHINSLEWFQEGKEYKTQSEIVG